jgi:signal transduction histidine kinase/ligand-binding sensor domain-containing protein/AraC-like DNA-binding protein
MKTKFSIPIAYAYKLLVILVLCFTCQSNLQAARFYSVNSIFGISTRVTNSICKDNNGFIWAASKTGILRLTEDDYRIYQLPYESAGVIIVKLIYQNSQLIAYTNNGQIFKYNPIYNRFDLLINLNKTLNDNFFDVFNLLIDDSDTFWIALSSGLYKYQSGKLTFIDNVSDKRYFTGWFDEKHLIIAKPEGISLIDIQTLQSEIVLENKNVSPFLVSSLLYDRSQNKLWIGTLSNGFFCYNFESRALTSILNASIPKQPILAIEENSNSTILIGIDGQGVWELNKNGTQLLNVYKESADDPYSLHGNGVYDIFYDTGKRVWISTISGGISFYTMASPLVNQIIHHSNEVNSLVNNDINSILEDRNGKIWFATNNGISCWNRKSNQWKNYYCNKLEQAQVFLALCEDDSGRIWAGSYSSGVYVLDGNTGKELAHYSHEESQLPLVSNFIFDILKDSQGDLWIGGVNGKFVCYKSKENKFKIYTEEPISSFAELAPNQIVLGCSYGVSLLDKQSGTIKTLLSGIVVQEILVINDEFWICTSGNGLLVYNYKDGKTQKFTTENGLPSNFINSIICSDGYLWLGTENGLCRFNPKDKTTLTFSSILPLSSISYNKSSQFKLKNGQLAWGTNNGAVFFMPNSISETTLKGKIFFQDLTISGRSIRDIVTFKLNTPVDSLKTINLKYFQNTLSLELLPIGVTSGAKLSWKMDGFDKEWMPATSNRTITYTNIPSGRYTLNIKLWDNSMSRVLSERTLAIELIPPFWRSAWFLVLMFTIILGIVFLYLQLYINKLKQKQTEEKVRFFTKIAHDIRTSLTLIKAPVEELNKEPNLSETGKYYLNLAIEQARRLSLVVTQLMDFQKVDVGKEHLTLVMTDIVKLISRRIAILDSFAKSQKINLVFKANKQSYITGIDELKIEKIVDNLISNAVKYSKGESEVKIDLQCDEKKWVLQVIDKGIGIKKKSQRKLFKEFYRSNNAINSKIVGSGIGLLLAKNYVSMHNGKISCISQVNTGSTFQIVIPYKSISKEAKPIQAAEAKSVNPVPEKPQANAVNTITHTEKELKILVVEDNDDLLNFMRIALCGDFKVYTALDGEKAWEFILKQTPDLVVSDIMMPHMDGYELCRLMKSTYETSHIPIVLLTALSDVTDQMHGLGLGADDYLTKPFDMALLGQKIKTIIRNREVVREKALKLIKHDSTEPILENELNDKFVKKMLEVAKANISNGDFNKEEFASAMNVSSSLLYKKIKALTDQSPTDFIKTIRLNHSLELLQTRKYSVTEVSELCGFASVGYFSTVFRKHYGKSPTEVAE